MRRALLAAACACATSVGAAPEAPRPELAAECRAALLFSAEHHDLAAANGRGSLVDYLGCARGGSSYALGAADFSVADGRWRYGKAGGVLRIAEGQWLAIEVKGGSGDNAAGAFDYFTVTDSYTVRAASALYTRIEHQFLDIDRDRGNLVKIAATLVPLERASVEIAATRSFDATFDTRQTSVRIDWIGDAWRLFAGGARGRSIPQVFELAAGLRPSPSTTRQEFAGIVLALAGAELGLLYDTQRTGASRRNTVTATLRWVLP